MTVSTNYDWSPEWDVVLRMGLQLAGLTPLGSTPSAQQLSHARFFLDAYLKSMKNSTFMLTQRELASTTLAVGTQTYVLAADTIDIDFPIMLTAPGDTIACQQVDPWAYEQYAETVDKLTQAMPIKCYVERLATVTLRFWPVPDKAYVASYRRKRLVRNADAGTTADASSSWIRAVTYQIAADMGRAGSMDLATVKDRQAMADQEFMKAENREVESVDLQFVLPEMY